MLTFSIRKTLSNKFLEELDRRRAERARIPPRASLPQAVPPQPFIIPCPWTKAKFTEFIEKVKEQYKVGQTVAPHYVVALKDELPTFTYKILYINELYSDVRFDTMINEPIVLILEPCDGGQNVSRCPCTVRPLYKEEQALVDLSNTPIQGSA